MRRHGRVARRHPPLAAGRAGGKASGQARAKAKAKQTLSKNEANVNDCLSKREAKAKHSISISKAKDKDLLKADAKQPPSLDEIKAFCASRSIPEQRAIDFYNYYQGQNLWLNKNKTPVRWWHIIQNSPWTDDKKRTTNHKKRASRKRRKMSNKRNNTKSEKIAKSAKLLKRGNNAKQFKSATSTCRITSYYLLALYQIVS